MTQVELQITQNSTHSRKRIVGLVWSRLAIPPIGIIAWDILWKFSIVSSIVSWGFAVGAVRIYTKVVGTAPDTYAAKRILLIVVCGIMLSFLNGMIRDISLAYSDHYHVSALHALGVLDFWHFTATNLLANGQAWQSYLGDIGLAVVFAVLGSYSIVRGLLGIKTEQVSA